MEGKVVKVDTVDEYIAAQPKPFKKTLEALRAIIREEVPTAEESISYGTPCYKHHYMLVGIGVTRSECSLYTMSPGLIGEMADELKGIAHKGATLHFQPGEDLPKELIRAVVRRRVEENEARASA